MSKYPSEAELKEAAERRHDSAARRLIAGVARAIGEHPKHASVAVPVATLQTMIEEIAQGDEQRVRFAQEALAWRRREQEATRPKGRFWTPSCIHCRFFKALQSPDASVAPVHQEIVNAPGACTYAPPTAVQRNAGIHMTTHAVFPPVHPDQVCGQFQPLGSGDEGGLA